MARRFQNIDRNTPLLLPPDLRDWVAEDDLVHFIIQAVDRNLGDGGQLEPGLQSIPGTLGQPTGALADCGYADEEVFQRLAQERPGLDLHMSMHREDAHAERPYDYRPPDKMTAPKKIVDPVLMAMAEKLKPPKARRRIGDEPAPWNRCAGSSRRCWGCDSSCCADWRKSVANGTWCAWPATGSASPLRDTGYWTIFRPPRNRLPPPRAGDIFRGVIPRLTNAVAFMACAVSLLAASDDAGRALFESRVAPLLREHCHKCHSHGAAKIKGGLVVDSRDALLVGGDSGPAIVPGDPEKSLLLQAVRGTNENLQMPPEKNGARRLNAEEIAALAEWIKLGAPWPGEKKSAQVSVPKRARGKITDEDRKWWAFQPLRAGEAPEAGVISNSVISKTVNGGAARPTGAAGTDSLIAASLIADHWLQNPIDRFLLAKQLENNLTPAPPADRVTLIRRVTFDLTGLPPAAAEVAAFVADKSSDAYEKLVDRLLASPRFGERSARHWLDLVRYAESDGFRVDDFRPNAWRYRDYVIRAFNNDKPYDRFVQEQIAGDELWPEDPDARIATGYLTLWVYEYNNRDVVGQWANILNDITDTTSDVFLGMGVQCARCHDHKFDPILQKDYYRLQAFFAALSPYEESPVASGGERAAFEQEMAGWEKTNAELLAKIARLEQPFRVKAQEDAISKFPPETKALIARPASERTPREQQYVDLAWRQVIYEWSYKRFPARIKEPAKTERNKLLALLRAAETNKPVPLAVAPQAADIGPVAPPTFVPKKDKLGEIAPGYLSVLDEAPAQIAAGQKNSTGRRATLAKWLTRPDNPLATRVIVNRVWQDHFGRGLAPITSDFGRLGEEPSHPELLDWLARRFVADGWSFKKLHRLIVTSAAYRQGAVNSESVISRSVSGASPDARRTDSLITSPKADPENKWLARFPTRRLDAEQVRDAALAATGELDLAEGGPGVDFSVPRRSIYNRLPRNTRDPVLEGFDAPEGFASTSQRNVTTTPSQSLLMINGKWTLARAKAFAARLEKEHPGDSAAQIRAAYQSAFSREPGAAEQRGAVEFLKRQFAANKSKPARAGAATFVSDKMPFRDGLAAALAPRSAQERFTIPLAKKSLDGDFTIEAFIHLKSIHEDAQVRTIASKWSGQRGQPGWSLGVTGAKSRNRPQTLVLQLSGREAWSAEDPVEPVFSGLHVDLSKPYFVAVSVKLDDPEGVTFYVKDLSNDDQPMQVVKVAHLVRTGIANTAPLVIGGRALDKQHAFDGLVDDVRLSGTALKQEQLLFTSAAMTEHTMGAWKFDMESPFRDSSPNRHDISPPSTPPVKEDPRRAALVDFCHVLLNANEFLYVD
jgi:cytochrome c553